MKLQIFIDSFKTHFEVNTDIKDKEERGKLRVKSKMGLPTVELFRIIGFQTR